jgi:hypothetical protein
MKNKLSLSLIALLFLLSTAMVKISSEITIDKMGVPPGTKKISDNLYLDQNQIMNRDYLEYMHWMKNVYGINSTEYKAVVPQTNNADSTEVFYSQHSKDAVVGVSNTQVQQYSKWRSDRVMEFTLIKFKIITYKPTVTKDSIFTIDKYFNGQYCNTKPNPYVLLYPEYSLPDSIVNTAAGFRNKCVYKKWQ